MSRTVVYVHQKAISIYQSLQGQSTDQELQQASVAHLDIGNLQHLTLSNNLD